MARPTYHPGPGDSGADNARRDHARQRQLALQDIERKFASGQMDREEYDAMRSMWD